jgi:glutathione S-transferase
VTATGLQLYDYELSDGCYKVRLLLSLLGVDYRKVPLDYFPGRAHETAEFRALEPLGTLPVLVDGALVLRDAQAILAYLARRYDASGQWLPADPAAFGRTMMWLGFAGAELAPAALARLHDMLGVPADEAAVQRAARVAFRVMDDHMTLREFDDGAWFADAVPTIADLALFPAIALSRDAGIEHDAFPALRRWIRRIRRLPGFIAMPGIPEYA